jgi:hypothetical protein
MDINVFTDMNTRLFATAPFWAMIPSDTWLLMCRRYLLLPFAGYQPAASSKTRHYNAERCNPNSDHCEILSYRFLQKHPSMHCHGSLIT